MHLLSRFAITALSAFITLATAHSWPEELQVIGPNGSYIGDRGFIRGYIARTDPTFNGNSDLWLLPELDARTPDGGVRLRINSSDLLCNPAQRTSNYSNPAYPKLKVNPGGNVAIKYLENGHVTLPWTLSGKPPLGGTVFVYGTTQPSNTEKIADVLEWNAAGTGGDKRGKLLTAQQYDDGRCHQINSCVNSAIRQVLYPNKIPGQPTAPSQEQWCETDVTIPTSQAEGSLTLYWVWQWPTAPGKDCTFQEGKDEYYTSCMDLDIVAGGVDDVKIADEIATNTLVQENFQTKAVSDYKSRPAFTPSPSFTLENWGGLQARATSVAPNPAFVSSCSAVLSSIAANAGVPPPSCPAGLYATGELFASISASVMKSRNTDVILAPGVSETFPASGAAPQPTAAPAPSAKAPGAAPSGHASSHAAPSRKVSSEAVPSAPSAPPAPPPAPSAPAPSAPAPSASAPSAPAPSVPSAPPASPTPSGSAPPPPPPGVSAPPPPGESGSGVVTATNRVVSTLTLTTIVTVPAGSPPQPSGGPPQQFGPPPQQSGAPPPAPPSGAPPQPSGSPPSPPPAGSQPGPGPHFNTITLPSGQAPTASAPAPPPNGSGNVGEHLERHRQHPRHF